MLAQIKLITKNIASDARHHGAKTFRSYFRVFFFNPSFRLILNYRIGHAMTKCNGKLARLLCSRLRYKQATLRCSHISYSSVIGKEIRFPHPIGIVIGDGAIVGDQVTIWQNVTLGSDGKGTSPNPYPVVQSRVKIYCGASVLGHVTLGEDSIIGAHALVLSDVPKGCTAVGMPAKAVTR